MRPTAATLTISALLAIGSAIPADAGTFEVKSPDITKGQTSFSWNSNFQRGFPVNADTTTGSTEFDLGYSPTSWFFIGGKLNLDQPQDESWKATTWGVETQLRFGKAQPGFDFGWYSSVDFRIADDQTNTFTFGPIIQFGDDKASLTLNPFLQQTFGANRQDGIAFAYGVQAKRQIKEGAAIGVEAYGTIPDIGSGTPAAFQDHRIGPALFLETEIGSKKPGKDEPPKATLDIGAYFGLTEGSPDLTGRVKIGFTW
jgi:hypothetical protein